MNEGSQEGIQSSVGRTIERVARESYGRLVAYLSAHTHDVASAEDALSDALVAALNHWPQDGVPQNPEAWLMTAARHSIVDVVRHNQVVLASEPALKLIHEDSTETVMATQFPDERLKLLFVCAHPAIDPSMHTPLMLQTVLGIDAARIAGAFLVPPKTMGQRLVRAKTKIQHGGIPFEIPQERELPQRLDAVLDAIYAAFGIGWDDMEGADQHGRNLAEEAIWLARVLLQLMPGEPEVEGLLALTLHCEARRAARRDRDGRYVPLSEQDPKLWSLSLIEEAGAPSCRSFQTWASGTLPTGSRHSVGPRRAGSDRPDRLECDRVVLRATKPPIADNRPSNRIRRRPCGGKQNPRWTRSSGCHGSCRSLYLPTLLGGSRPSPASSGGKAPKPGMPTTRRSDSRKTPP